MAHKKIFFSFSFSFVLCVGPLSLSSQRLFCDQQSSDFFLHTTTSSLPTKAYFRSGGEKRDGKAIAFHYYKKVESEQLHLFRDNQWLSVKSCERGCLNKNYTLQKIPLDQTRSDHCELSSCSKISFLFLPFLHDKIEITVTRNHILFFVPIVAILHYAHNIILLFWVGLVLGFFVVVVAAEGVETMLPGVGVFVGLPEREDCKSGFN